MASKNSTKTSLLILALIEIFERFSYYGMRAIVIIFAIDNDGLNLSSDAALGYYAQFTLLLGLITLPMGLFSDLVLKQKNGVLVGGTILTIGYLCLLGSNFYMTMLSMILIIIGTGLFRPNLTVLVGRLFEKKDRKRNLAFVIIYWIINIGSFAGVVLVGYYSENYGWKYGFILCALSMFLAVLIFYFTKDKLQLNELNEKTIRIPSEKYDSPILDNFSEVKIQESRLETYPNHLLLIIFFAVTGALFWNCNGVINNSLYTNMTDKTDLLFFGYSMTIWTQLLPAILSLFALFLFLIYSYFVRLHSSVRLIGVGFFLLGTWGLMINQINVIPDESLVIFLIGTGLLTAMAEVLVSPILLSYVTRLSSIKYASTMVALFMVMPYLTEEMLDYLRNNIALDLPILQISIITLGIGTLFFVSKKALKERTGGLD